MAQTPISDNWQLNAPKVLDNRSGRFSSGSWRPYNDLAEFDSAQPLLSRAETLIFWVRSITDTTKADLYTLDINKQPYKVLEEVDLSDYYTKQEIDNHRSISPDINTFEWNKTNEGTTDHDRDGAALVTAGDFLFLLGGWTPPTVPTTDSQVYRFSKDLTSTTKLADAPWEGRHTFGVASNGNDVYVFGGDYQRSHYQKDMWKGTLQLDDTLSWSLVNNDLPWGNRVLFGSVLHNGSIYVIGGQDNTFTSGNGFSDVWKTTDWGVTWTKIADGLTQFRQNMYGTVVSFNGYIYVVSGGIYQGGAQQYSKQVWRSLDGATWERMEDTPFVGRQYPATETYQNKIIISGGTNIIASPSTPSGNLNDTWSMDVNGKWTELAVMNGKPTVRHAAAYAVYDNKFVISTGNFNTENNTWTLAPSERVLTVNELGYTGTIKSVGNVESLGVMKVPNKSGEYRVGDMSSAMETGGNVSAIFGNGIRPSYDNSKIGKRWVDAGNWIRFNYLAGMTFHTGVTGYLDVAENFNQRMNITNAGLIGIAEPNPTERLDVSGNIKASGTGTFGGRLIWGTGSYPGNSLSGVYNSSVSGTVFKVNAGSTDNFILASPTGGTILNVPTGATNIVATGKITIGGTPTASSNDLARMVDVANSITTETTLQKVTERGATTTVASRFDGGLAVGRAGTALLDVYVANSVTTTLGKFTNNHGALHIYKDATGGGIFTPELSGWYLSNGTSNYLSNGSSRITILSTGNTGFGITPTEKLDVNGNARIRGVATVDSAPVNATDVARKNEVDLKANINSPTFTGAPILPSATTGATQLAGDNSTRLATTAFVANVVKEAILSKFGDYTVSMVDFGSSGRMIIYVDATTISTVITIPSVANLLGYTINVVKTDATANTVTVTGSANINGASTKVLTTQYEFTEIHSNNTQYYAK